MGERSTVGDPTLTKEDKSVLKLGSFGKVTLLEGALIAEFQAESVRATGTLARFRRFFTSEAISKKEKLGVDLSLLATAIVTRGVITEGDLQRLPQGLDDQTQFDLSGILTLISVGWDGNRANRIHSGVPAQDIPYDKGQYISDTLEVLPRADSSRIIFGASDAGLNEIHRDTSRMAISTVHNPQALAIEGFSLLPRSVRLEIFEAIAKLEPGRSGRAANFLRLLVNNYTQKSALSAMGAIDANIKDGTALARINELRSQFGDFGAVLDAV